MADTDEHGQVAQETAAQTAAQQHAAPQPTAESAARGDTEDAGTAEGEPDSGTGERMSGWEIGCLVALLTGIGLFILGALLLAELEKGLDGYGQIEGDADGTTASVAAPLAAGATARYEDGLSVTVGEAERVAGAARGTYRFTVTYENDAHGELRIGARDAVANVSEYGDAPLVVRAGDSLDDTSLDGSTSDWHNSRAVGRKLSEPLGEDESVTVPVRVTVRPGDGHQAPLTVAVLPGGEHSTVHRDTAYWEMTLRA
ncbi:hypothetical protein ACH4RA_31000 [Streptomyces smyrnaeus]|uniref:hypothetical protein n=1 Tax=Streptomyces smyrnaeus TaxID=1387713 RepID=UPI0037B1C46C